MALSDTPMQLLTLLEDEAGFDERRAETTRLCGALLALFAPDYTEPPYTVKGLSHLRHLLHRWNDALSTEIWRLHTCARLEIQRLQQQHECIACMSEARRTSLRKAATTADRAQCPVMIVVERYGVVL